MKIKVLMENTSCRDEILCEHGLSLYVETEGRRILFDSGQTANFAQNAEKMGVDLSSVDFAVLSHGHYDHSGGLKKFLELNDKAPVYLNRQAFEPHYHGPEKYIGIDPSLKGNDRLILTGDYRKIAPGLELFSCNDRACRFPIQSFGLSVKTGDIFTPDSFRHEHYLLIHEGGKTVLLSGCSHKGILNITEWFRPDFLIGGFHFSKLDPEGEGRETLEQAAEILMQYPTQYATCHCTGLPAYRFLKERMGEQLRYLSAGQTVCIDGKTISDC